LFTNTGRNEATKDSVPAAGLGWARLSGRASPRAHGRRSRASRNRGRSRWRADTRYGRRRGTCRGTTGAGLCGSVQRSHISRGNAFGTSHSSPARLRLRLRPALPLLHRYDSPGETTKNPSADHSPAADSVTNPGYPRRCLLSFTLLEAALPNCREGSIPR
jgi:hypothetical protein